MNLFLCCLLAAAVAYLLGSISFAVIFSRLLDHDDVRLHGSGNAGMTNMLRTYGVKQAALVCLGDFGKGILAVVFARLLFGWAGITVMDGGYVGGFFVLLGHLFPLYFGFRGGKGVLTSAGIMLMLNPVVFLCLVPPIVALILITRIVSLGSIVAAVIYPILTYVVLTLQGRPAALDTLFAALIGVIVIFMHRSNIKRLLNGTENRFSRKPKGPQPEQPSAAPQQNVQNKED